MIHTPSTTIIKSDRAGRPRYTQKYRSEVLAAYEASGMSGPAFAKHCGLKYPTFAAWVAKQRREKSSPKTSSPKRQFVVAEFEEGPHPDGLQIELPGGASARLAHVNQIDLVVSLIRALSR
jgi:transposase-like protein